MVDALGRAADPARSRLQVNNRKLIQGFYRGLGIADVPPRCGSSTSSTSCPATQVARACSSSDAGLDRRAGRSSAWSWRRSGSQRHLVRRAGARARRQHELLDEGLAELAAVVEGCAPLRQRPGRGRGRPEDRPRPRLLHRHGLRDLPGRLRAARVGRRRRALRRARHRRPDDVPRRRHLPRRHPHARPAARRGRARPAAGRCRAPCSSPWSTRRTAAPATRSPTALRARGIPCEVAAARRRSSASRSATPSAAASRTSGSQAPTASQPRSRTSAAATRSPADPATWTPPEADVRPTISSTAARHQYIEEQPVIRTHDAGSPARRARRPDRHPRRLGGPAARPRRRGVHRPARGQRRRPGGHPRRGGRAQPAQRVLPEGHRRGRRRAPRATRTPTCPPARSR